MSTIQMQAQQAAQQAQHAAQVESMSKEAAEMESLIRHGEQQDQQRVAELNAHRVETNDLRQVTMKASPALALYVLVAHADLATVYSSDLLSSFLGFFRASQLHSLHAAPNTVKCRSEAVVSMQSHMLQSLHGCLLGALWVPSTRMQHFRVTVSATPTVHASFDPLQYQASVLGLPQQL